MLVGIQKMNLAVTCEKRFSITVYFLLNSLNLALNVYERYERLKWIR